MHETIFRKLDVKTEGDPVFGTLCFLVFRVPDDLQSPETQ
jgi:hypothetical protein